MNGGHAATVAAWPRCHDERTVERQEQEPEVASILSTILKVTRDERGAEMVEWIVVVAVLATVAAIIFGPGGVLSNAMNNGVNTIGNIITNAS
jgi:hypothetical protein